MYIYIYILQWKLWWQFENKKAKEVSSCVSKWDDLFLVYSLDGHPGHRLQRIVAGCSEVVSVTVHLNGFQPVGNRAEGRKVRRALVQQRADWPIGGGGGRKESSWRKEKKTTDTQEDETKRLPRPLQRIARSGKLLIGRTGICPTTSAAVQAAGFSPHLKVPGKSLQRLI